MKTTEVKDTLAKAATATGFRKKTDWLFGKPSRAVAISFRHHIRAELNKRDDYKKLTHSAQAERLCVSPNVVQNIFSDCAVGPDALQAIGDKLGLDWPDYQTRFKATGKRDQLITAYTASLRQLWPQKADDFPPHTAGLFESMHACIQQSNRLGILKRFGECDDLHAMVGDVRAAADVPLADAHAVVCWDFGRLLTQGGYRLLTRAAQHLEQADRENLLSGLCRYEGLVARVHEVDDFQKANRDYTSDADVLREAGDRLRDAFGPAYGAGYIRDTLAGATVEMVVNGLRPPGWFVCHDAVLGPMASRALGLLAQGK